MYDNYNYPWGADNASAPWNESSQDAREFEVEVTETLTRRVTIETENYEEYSEQEEDGGWYGEISTDDTDWSEEYNTSYDTLDRVFDDVRELLAECVDVSRLTYRQRLKYDNVLSGIAGWKLYDQEVEQV